MTWTVCELAVQSNTLDFTSSGQGHYLATQVFLDGALFANAVGLTAWNDDRIQVVVCAACGAEHCETGGWLTLRSVGALRVFLPMFSEWRSEQDQGEYAPPRVVMQRGAPLFEPHIYAQLRQVVSELPASPPPLSGPEACALFRFEAPAGVHLASDRSQLAREFVAAENGEVEEAMDAIIELLAQLQDAGPMQARPLAQDDRPLRLHANNAGFTEWTPLAISKQGPRLLWGRWVLERESCIANR